MKVTFLGTNGWFDTATGNTPSILVQSEKFDIILDAGNGIARADRYITQDKPVFLFLSHFHIDHIAGLHILVKFQFRNVVTKMEPPNHLEMEGEGYDLIAKAGRFVQKSVVDLKETEQGEVEVSYRTDVNIVGKLAMFGDRVIRTKARQTEEEFTSKLKERLKGLA